MRSHKLHNLVGSFCLVVFTCATLFAQGKSGKAVDLESEMPADSARLKIGDPPPDFSLPGIDGKTYTLADFKDAPVLMVAFLSNHCPVSHAAETRIIPMAQEYKSRGLAVVAINPNSPEGIDVSELGYSKYNDSFDEMKLYAKEKGFNFPYLYDGATQKTAKAYGCLCTPHVFIFDKDRKLRYMGSVDDSRFADAATVKSTPAKDAIDALLNGKPVPVDVTKPFGCSTKWLEKKPLVEKLDQQWMALPVTMEKIDAAGVSKLLKNDTKKLRVINVWATWCAPCVAEFPSLVSLSRRMGNRDFELITISADEPADEAKALDFLQKQHAAVPGRVQRSLKAEGRATNNYLFTGNGGGSEELLKVLDPQAAGPLPHTLVIEPGAKVLYRIEGPLDFPDFQAKLIDKLGPYYTP
jgi:peroxiredoxin